MAIVGAKIERTHVIDLILNKCSVTKTNGKKEDGPDLPMSCKMKKRNVRKPMIKVNYNTSERSKQHLLDTYIKTRYKKGRKTKTLRPKYNPSDSAILRPCPSYT